jgi:acetyl-CoA carboxylase biotin carboxylase subunit
MKTIRKILIANRGEIALRVMRTCRAMGIASAAVHSDVDIRAPHVVFADEAIHIGDAAAKESYLNIEKIIDAAGRVGADAIHPGYGFLSENADFALACEESGITFIGPSSEAIRSMGSKRAAKQIMQDAGVPVIPGYGGDDQRAETLKSQALFVGLPILIKASAGGGGKGMRVIHLESQLDEGIAAARREAERSFGDPTLILEKYIAAARHIEFQIIADHHGCILHLFERDCSIQRRHQKIIEESPAPGMTPELRSRIGEAAVAVAHAINYTNAGTVEFILSPSGEFSFIEMNTRLQVEHPVTELVTGIDLVKLQILVAEGRKLELEQENVRQFGHAIEARLYAEDPANEFLPSTGTIHDWHLPTGSEGLRIDSGIQTNSEVGIHYDPLLAKVIAHSDDRDTAIRKLVRGLQSLSVLGVRTNRDFLISLLNHEEFHRANISTGFVVDHFNDLTTKASPKENFHAAAVAAVYLAQKREANFYPGIPPDYRNNPFRDPSIKFEVAGEALDLSYRLADDRGYRLYSGDRHVDIQVVTFATGSIRLLLDGIQRSFRVVEAGNKIFVNCNDFSREITRPSRYPRPQTTSEHESANAPMPGQVLKVLIAPGQKVSAGDPLVILEAMKMEQTLRASTDGVVEAVHVQQGDVVAPGDVLVNISAHQTSM